MFGKFTANVEIAGPFKIEIKPYTMTIADKTDVSSGGNTTSTETSEPTESETVAAVSVAEKEPAEESVTAGDESFAETKPVKVTTATTVGEIEVPTSGKGEGWTVVSVLIGVSAAAAGIVILKITKIL